MSNDTSTIHSIKLNNFLHRIDSKATIIDIVDQHACHLKRIRRSRNWSLSGYQDQLTAISHLLLQQNILWIAEAIDNTLPAPTFDLASIIRAHPNTTVNQLMAKTGCTLREARSAIDNAEGFI